MRVEQQHRDVALRLLLVGIEAGVVGDSERPEARAFLLGRLSHADGDAAPAAVALWNHAGCEAAPPFEAMTAKRSCSGSRTYITGVSRRLPLRRPVVVRMSTLPPNMRPPILPLVAR